MIKLTLKILWINENLRMGRSIFKRKNKVEILTLLETGDIKQHHRIKREYYQCKKSSINETPAFIDRHR
jgi:hypothetical protein